MKFDNSFGYLSICKCDVGSSCTCESADQVTIRKHCRPVKINILGFYELLIQKIKSRGDTAITLNIPNGDDIKVQSWTSRSFCSLEVNHRDVNYFWIVGDLEIYIR